jgi:hypothetical protein
MLEITNPWILLVIGFVLMGLTAFDYLALGFAVASIIPFVLGLHYMLQDKKEIKQVGF